MKTGKVCDQNEVKVHETTQFYSHDGRNEPPTVAYLNLVDDFILRPAALMSIIQWAGADPLS